MNENARPNDIVDTTDCFEAITAFRGMKNLLFMIILICLLLLQIAFWANQTGCIDKTDSPLTNCCPQSPDPDASSQASANIDDVEPVQPPEETGDELKIPAELIVPLKLGIEEESVAAEVTIAEQAEKVVQQTEDAESQAADGSPAAEEATQTEQAEPKKSLAEKFRPTADCVTNLIKVCNFIVVIAATLYCLILLMSIKISLCGRLGGISHISRAFIFSLYVFVFLLPWQTMLPGIVVGAIYTPQELFAGWNINADSSMPLIVLYYLRFTGMWLAVLLLLFCSQLRSRRWSKTTLRRLGMLH